MVKIISDSTCDLSQELLERYDISVLPLHILLGEKEYCDGVDITPDEIYRWSDEQHTTPKTSAPALDMTMELMKPFINEKRQIVCFAISEDMSTSANVMRMAARELEAEELVTVIDSASLSTGIGLLVIHAAEMAQTGKNAEEIRNEIEELKPKVRASFVVDTLVYLYRGGRCGGLTAMFGSALQMHPMIVVENGKMKSTKKYRGKSVKVIMDYAKDLREQMEHARKERVFITHSGCSPEVVEKVREYLEGLNIFEEILITRAGGVISSHCGPGTLGILFISDVK